MALAKKSSNSSRIVIVGVVIVIVAVIGYVLFQQFFLKPDAEITNGTGLNPDRAVISNFGDAILQDPRLTTLQPANINISADADTDGGQPNPFQ